MAILGIFMRFEPVSCFLLSVTSAQMADSDPFFTHSVGSLDPGEPVSSPGQKIELLLPPEDRTADLGDSVLKVIFLAAVTKNAACQG